MKFDTPTVSASDAAAILRVKLGPYRAWRDFLADNIRGKQHLHGLFLLPCCEKKKRGLFRPMYAIKDIDTFVEKVLSLDPSAGRTPIERIILSIDPAKHWKLNRFNEDGSPSIH